MCLLHTAVIKETIINTERKEKEKKKRKEKKGGVYAQYK